MRRIGIFCGQQHAWGRLLCEGIAAFAKEHRQYELVLLEPADLRQSEFLSSFDGFIARVYNRQIAAAFQKTGKPTANVSSAITLPPPFFCAIFQDNTAISQLAARHFIEHHFVHFAYCGFDGIRFSDERRNAFVRCLRLNHFDCAVYEAPESARKSFLESLFGHERIGCSLDHRQLQFWLRQLPKPVGVFCADDLRGHQVMRACKDCGLVLPNEVAVLGVNNDSLICNFTTPTLSSIEPDAFSVGYTAAGLLKQVLDGTTPVPPRKIRPKGLAVRSSTDVYPLEPAWLSEALVFIRRNINRHISAADVCAHLRLSHTAVNRAFRDKLGTTVQKAIREAQITEAKRLLHSTSLSVAEIARLTGFATPQYFCNVYTGRFGHPPSALRQQTAQSRLRT